MTKYTGTWAPLVTMQNFYDYEYGFKHGLRLFADRCNSISTKAYLRGWEAGTRKYKDNLLINLLEQNHE